MDKLQQTVLEMINHLLAQHPELAPLIETFAVNAQDEFTRAHRAWVRDNGDQTRRLDYPLTETSVVFDVGGFVGDFAQQIVDRFNATVFLFEPVRKYHEACVNRFAGNPKVRCFHFGLADTDGTFRISDANDASSITRMDADADSEVVAVRCFADFVAEQGIRGIDLLKVNIEGGEYPLLPHLLDRGLAPMIGDLQVQFHNFIPDAVAMRNTIRERLQATHRETWNYPFVWENWTRR